MGGLGGLLCGWHLCHGLVGRIWANRINWVAVGSTGADHTSRPPPGGSHLSFFFFLLLSSSFFFFLLSSSLSVSLRFTWFFAGGGEGFLERNSFRAVSEQFPINFRIFSEQFQMNFQVISEQFQSSFRAGSEQFQSSFGAVTKVEWVN